jgi:purine-nucleoside phosphorylase
VDPRFQKRLSQVYRSIVSRSEHRPSLGIVTGSGFGDFISGIDGDEITWSSIKRFPRSSVTGHPGVMKINSRLVVMGGRVHLYEGYEPDDVVLPVFLLHALGVRKLILTNAAGGIREGLDPGAIVLIRDQINLTGCNPLTGASPGSRFCDMTDAYSSVLRLLVQNHFPDLPEGVYAGLTGPSYETPAEIDMLERLGADMVGMSTVLETIAARFLGMDVIGLSLITNRAAGRGTGGIAHGEVLAAGRAAEAATRAILLRLVELLAEPAEHGHR